MMKRLLNITTVLVIITLAAGCQNDETDVVYTRIDGETLTAIQLFDNEKILISEIPLWKVNEHDDLYMCYGRIVLAASYQKANGFAYLMKGRTITDERIFFDKEGLKYKG